MPILAPDHQLYSAVDAMKRYHEAQASARPGNEIERLRQIAESHLRAVNEYQFRAMGRHSSGSIN
ncbi:hypothetical protein NJF44_21375 [Pseudomonas guariconensis]|uniref:hypothetical protein n=1 Tax=Pseudomonas TaxID=286 RepID=UPI001CE3E799|nr:MULTISPECIES: hypothetical protein [Pseudomonas]MCO7514767.1 hypothetical protein [Pseudomonas putida]MCO7607791.1 hypothetical protein [Pseudomonas guariconensis]MCO7630871.1 hypothetical protein [Pseudomonas guariconensis]